MKRLGYAPLAILSAALATLLFHLVSGQRITVGTFLSSVFIGACVGGGSLYGQRRRERQEHDR